MSSRASATLSPMLSGKAERGQDIPFPLVKGDLVGDLVAGYAQGK
jgi:hypothetical protein